MLIPLSWLKDFVDIKLPLKELMWKMTEAGLTCESYKKEGDETILDVEVTANRPDWMSIIGVAREIAAIQGVNVKEPKVPTLPKKSANFPIDLENDPRLFERWSAIVLKDVKIKPSPKWLSDKIRMMGHSPINNVIDITNYLMYEYGLPMHAFDYDEIRGQLMKVQLSKGGEDFTSVDNIAYKLPKNALVIYDSDRLIDLAGIKGGLNSGIKDSTQNVLLHITIDNPVLVRRTSQAMGLRSEASAIYERGPDKGGTVNALIRAAKLIIDEAGGEVASDIIDIKQKDFKPWKLSLSFNRLEKVLGIKIPEVEVLKILDKLNLNPKKIKAGISCTIPTYRGDLLIEEDLIEEVARIYGYNNFPLTLPKGTNAPIKIPYYFDDSNHQKIKSILTAAGYSEMMALSLVSGETLNKYSIDSKHALKILNPVSSEYEYLRPTLIPSVLTAMIINHDEKVSVFELDKIFPSEEYKVAGVSKGVNFREFKGVVDILFDRLNIKKTAIQFETDKVYLHPSKSGTIKVADESIGEFGELSPVVQNNLGLKETVFCFEFDVAALQKHSKINSFKVVPENPAQVEDVTLSFPPKTRIGDVVSLIKANSLVSKCELTTIYNNKYSFRIWYQDPKETLTNIEVEKLRKAIIASIKSRFGGRIKE